MRSRASRSLHGLTRLNVWWLRLGIQHQRIHPGRPQENGAHERMHRTLKRAAIRPPRQDAAGQQRAFHTHSVTYLPGCTPGSGALIGSGHPRRRIRLAGRAVRRRSNAAVDGGGRCGPREASVACVATAVGDRPGAGRRTGGAPVGSPARRADAAMAPGRSPIGWWPTEPGWDRRGKAVPLNRLWWDVA